MDEKVCMVCKVTKTISQFSRNHLNSDGRLNSCKACEYLKIGKYRRRNQALVWGWKTTTGCEVCGYQSEHSHHFDGHHLNPETKSFSLGHSLSRSVKSVELEIEKCVCLCLFCHSDIHANEMTLQEI